MISITNHSFFGYKKEHTDALLKLCVKGKASAQLEIYNRYYKATYNTSVRIVMHIAEAGCDARIVLSAFTKLLHTFKGEVTFGSWLNAL